MISIGVHYSLCSFDFLISILSRYATDAIHFKYADEDGLFESSFVKQRKNTSGNLQNNESDSEFKETNHQERSRGRSSDRNARKRRSQSLVTDFLSVLFVKVSSIHCLFIFNRIKECTWSSLSQFS